MATIATTLYIDPRERVSHADGSDGTRGISRPSDVTIMGVRGLSGAGSEGTVVPSDEYILPEVVRPLYKDPSVVDCVHG